MSILNEPSEIVRRTGAVTRGSIGRVAILGLVIGALTLAASGAKFESAQVGSLQVIATHALSISEPSGLTIDETGTKLWTVTNNPDRVYQLDLDGNPVKTLDYVGQDLEAIAYDASDKTLWIAEESRREIVHLDLNGKVLSRHLLDLTGEKNSGLEGICLDDRGRMFALNEKRPGLFIELNSDRAIAAKRELDFAKDYSDISYNRKKACFWILSDQSQALYLWSKRGGAIAEYPLPFPKAEGIAVDEAAGRIYIVSDSENKLYVYQNPASERFRSQPSAVGGR